MKCRYENKLLAHVPGTFVYMTTSRIVWCGYNMRSVKNVMDDGIQKADAAKLWEKPTIHLEGNQETSTVIRCEHYYQMYI